VYSIEEVVELFHNAQTSAERVRAVLYLGVSVTGEFKEELFAEFLRAFSDPEPNVRSAAIHACTYVGWREFRDVLGNLKENDPNETIRSEAESTFNVFAMTEEERLAFIKQRRGEE
jgi:transglutaminase-like putative cysteine protease